MRAAGCVPVAIGGRSRLRRHGAAEASWARDGMRSASAVSYRVMPCGSVRLRAIRWRRGRMPA